MGWVRYLSIITAVSVLSLPAFAEESARKPVSRAEFTKKVDQVFSSKDLDFDGYLSEDEQKSSRTKQRKDRDRKDFLRLDENKDRHLSYEEYKRGRFNVGQKSEQDQKKAIDQQFDSMDSDRNGHISRKEFHEAKEKRQKATKETLEKNFDRHWKKEYERRDIDKDGRVSQIEYVEGTDDQGRQPEKKQKDNRQSLFLGRGEPVKIPRQDANGDKRISRYEYERYYEKLFEVLDKDRDAVLSIDEQNIGSRYLRHVLPAKSGPNFGTFHVGDGTAIIRK